VADEVTGTHDTDRRVSMHHVVTRRYTDWLFGVEGRLGRTRLVAPFHPSVYPYIWETVTKVVDTGHAIDQREAGLARSAGFLKQIQKLETRKPYALFLKRQGHI
jgi:hypothetical protein